tara:strand:- start:763 stop:999 length:237 start_codon:yes stop_codon:yes gene_type:complete
MDKKYLDKVVDQIISETNVDYEREELHVPFLHRSCSSSDFYTSITRSYVPFVYHCRDVYGLDKEETEYVWAKWKTGVW